MLAATQKDLAEAEGKRHSATLNDSKPTSSILRQAANFNVVAGTSTTVPSQAPLPTPPASERRWSSSSEGDEVSSLNGKIVDQQSHIRELEARITEQQINLDRLRGEQRKNRVAQRQAIQQDDKDEIARLRARIEELDRLVEEYEKIEKKLQDEIDTGKRREAELRRQLNAARTINEGIQNGATRDDDLNGIKEQLEHLRREFRSMNNSNTDCASPLSKPTSTTVKRRQKGLCIVTSRENRTPFLPV